MSTSACAFVIGICGSILFGSSVNSLFWQIMASIATAVILLSYQPKMQIVSKLGMALGLGIAIGSVRTAQLSPSPNLQPQTLNQRQVVATGVVTALKESNTGLILTLDQPEVNHQLWPGYIQTNAPLFSNVAYGDQISAAGQLQASQSQQEPWRSYYLHHQIYAQIGWAQIKVLAHNRGNPLLSLAYNLQQLCQRQIIKLFPRDEAGLLLGVVLGLQQPLSDGFSQALNTTSTTHMIVASGYNATIIVATCLKLTPYLKRNPTMLLAVVLLCMYAAIAGLSASILRAVIMAIIGIVGVSLGRQRTGLQLLVLTAGAMLIWNPLWLYDTSTQLSFAATLGVMTFEPIVADRIRSLPDWLGETISTTIAAQLFTYPIIAATFGTISAIGMVANLLVLWLIPWLMLSGAILILIAIIWLPLAALLSIPLEAVLWYIKHTILLSANLPLASISLQIPILLLIVYYFGLSLWSHQFKSRPYISL